MPRYRVQIWEEIPNSSTRWKKKSVINFTPTDYQSFLRQLAKTIQDKITEVDSEDSTLTGKSYAELLAEQFNGNGEFYRAF